MNLSRLAVLAVFFMMIMSAFVTVPTYNVAADDHEESENDENGDECPFDEDNPDSPCNAQECIDHESQECRDFIENYCANNEDSYCFAAGMDMVCYDVDTHEINFDIRTEEDCVAAGLMWVSPISGPDNGRDDGNVGPVAFHATMTMESLEEWTVDYSGEMPVDWSNDMRNEISNMCEMMMGTDEGEITEECFSHWLDMMMSGDEHGDHDDEFRCPPDMDDTTCETLMGCGDGDADMFECMSVMYNYCYDNTDSEMCEDMMGGDEDDGGEFVFGLLGYEAGHIDATTLMEEYIIPEFGDFMDDGDDGSYEDSGRPVLYDVQTFDVDSDGELRIYQNFLPDVKTTPDFVCGSGSVETVPFNQVNDGDDNCEDGSDEQQYDDEDNEINWFDCHDGSEIWIHQVNNGEWDCEDGEDEYQEHHHYWWGDVYLIEGDYSDGIKDTMDPWINVAVSNSHCYWNDDNETDFTCDDFMSAEISTGTWSLVTIGSCHQEWDYDDEGNWVVVGYDCHGENDNHTNMGPYSHKLQFGDARWAMNGSIHHESMEMENFPHFDTWNNDDKEEFAMYQTQSFSIDTDSSVSIFSAGWNCYDYDEDGVDDDCWGNSPGLYIYHDEDLIASNKHYHSEDLFCPVESEDQDYSNCSYAMLEVDLVAGDYTIYTTLNSEASYYNNIDGAYVVVDGEESDEWDGHMRDNYWDWDEEAEEEVLVEGTASRDYFPQADYHDYEYEPECYDEDGNMIDCDDVFEMFVYMFMIAENATHYEAGNLTAVEAADNSVELFYMLVDAGMFERGEDDHDHHGDDPNGDEPGLHHHGDEDYHHQHGDSDTSSHADYDRHHDHDDNHGDHDDHGDHNGHDHDEHHDEDDNPALLDGIVGVNDPEGAEPMPMAENMIGALSDNEGLPMMMGTNFKIHFEGVDASLETHEAYIPIGGDGSGTVWHVEMTLLEGYEVISCEKCEDLEIDGNRAKFHSNEPVMVMFGKAATTEECDQTVTIGEGGYTFEPAEITISVGDTVCWIWENTADVHNVIAVTDLDSLVNLESGFNSGEPSQTVDFRYTFTEDSMTYYYVCEPHATMGMVGTVTVGTGSEDDRIPEIIDDSGLPNVSFIVGALVLVGAAGLRRRIH